MTLSTAVAERLPVTLRGYRRLAGAATPLTSLILASRLRRGKEDPQRIGERRGNSSVERPAGPLIWVHGASVGEMLTLVPLIERLRAKAFNVMVTSGTLTSARLARQRLPQGVIHQFVPYDAPQFIRRFLDHWRPDLALFAEQELWPNLIMESAGRSIPLILVNGRMSEQSFSRWRHAPATIAALLRCFDLCFAQSGADGERYTELGAARVSVPGNLKLDVPAPSVDAGMLAALQAGMKDRPIIAASSTHPGEEAPVIDVHRRLRHDFPGLVTIVAPRHPERGREIADLATAAGLSSALRSRGRLPDRGVDLYIADTLGELGLIYRLSPMVFMGGSLIRHGGQNPIEPAKLGAAIIHGPHVWNFSEIYAALDAARGADRVTDAGTLAARFGAWLGDPTARKAASDAARRTIERLGGGLERTLAALEPHLMQLKLEQR
jgi:3-deoxy-D-manno-octulosonic-acid transferase